MNCEEIISTLKSMASEKYKANVIKMGIPEAQSIGVSTAELRGLAKNIGKSNELAYELWNTGYHEARLLAALLFDKKNLSPEDMDPLMSDVISWDLCDHLCKNLIIKLKGYHHLIAQWISSEHAYKKRAAFTLIASAAIHDKTLSDEDIEEYLELINEYSRDPREHVKKAASWALREIGKRDFDYNEKAILLAREFQMSGDKAQAWIGKDALKELENLVKAEGRKRLISANSQMGKQS